MASVSTIVTTVITELGAAIKGLKDLAGSTANLTTTDKTTLVAAINELNAAVNATSAATAALIDDAAGIGAKTVVWSADKSATEIAALWAALGDLSIDVTALVAATQA